MRSTRSNKRLRHLALIPLIPIGALASAAGGQPIPVTSVGGPPFVEVWVDACNGNDAFAQVGCVDSPFQHISTAVNAVAPFASPLTPALVHINPGIYSQATNGETFPIVMRDNVHLQGTGARQCVIRGHNFSEHPQTTHNVFIPQDPGCVCGTYADLEVLIDLSFLFQSMDEEMIDGLTFQGGDIQVYSRNEALTKARVSNCVFDMLDKDPTHNRDATLLTPGATFGILLVHDYHPGVPYFDVPVNILNNTFIQGWVITDDSTTVTARSDAVAICDVNNPLCNLPPGQSDPNTRLRGVGNPNIQNNIIRHASGAMRTALLGIDGRDVIVRFGSQLGPSNAFNPRAVGGRDVVTGTYCSLILGANPVPRVNTEPVIPGGRDPGFVGEMLTRAFAQPPGVSRDWRLLPSSVCVDLGSSPRAGILQAGNLTMYVEPSLVPLSSFDLDGEVYGNPRINGRDVDIGFDETDLLVDCAGWANDSVSHRAACANSCSPADGQAIRGLIFPTTGAFTLFETRVGMPQAGPFPCGGFYVAYTTMPGTIVPPITLAGFMPPHDLLWMDPLFVTTGPSGSVGPVAYTAPSDPTILNFGLGVAGVNTGPCVYLNEQAFFVQTGSTVRQLSNCQSSTE